MLGGEKMLDGCFEEKCNGVFFCPKCHKDIEGCPFDYRDDKGEVDCKNKPKGK